jgi:flagellum-specific peptidoglycan hydrolase FlgJ
LAGITNESADAAEHARENNAALGLAFSGLGNAIGERFTPDITSATTALSHWIESAGKSVHAGGDATTSVTLWTRAMEAFGIAVTAGAFGPLRRLETMLLKIVAIRPAAWMLRLLGVAAGAEEGGALAAGAGVVGAAAAVAGGAYLGYKGAVQTGTGIAQAGNAGLRPAMMDEFGNPVGYVDKSGKYYTNEEAAALGKAAPEPPAPTATGQSPENFPVPQTHPSARPSAQSGGGDKNAFVAQHMAKAIEESQKTGVDPRIILAQSGLETGWGAHAPQNNYFGIKGGGASETTQEFVNGKMVTTQANFAGYQSPDASFDAYADFINKNPRYAAMKSAHGLDAQTAALGASGYATDPDYASKIKGIASGIEVPSAPPVQVASTTQASGPAASIAGGTGGSAAAQAVTVKGSADLNVRVSAPTGTTTTASTSGDLFQGAPKIMQAFPLGATT